jgi:hypothetical protein
MADVDSLLSEYDGLLSDASVSTYEFFGGNLRQWLLFMDRTPEISAIIQNLERSVDFEGWKKEGLIPQSGTGHGRIVLPEDPQARLAIQLGLFRWLSKEEDSPWKFAHEYVSSETNLNRMISDLVDQVFRPFSQALRRHLNRQLATSASDNSEDRIIKLTRDSAWNEAIKALDAAKRALEQANDPIEEEVRSQRVSELAAGRELLHAKQATFGAISATAGSALRWLAVKFADVGVGKLASIAWDKVLKYLLGGA